MKQNVELTELEIGIITDALNEYWHESNKKLENKERLGDIEKLLLQQRKDYAKDLLMKFENI